jgi:hypothetical protein
VNGKTEWSQEDFARMFLGWLAMTDTNYHDGWVWFPDIRKHLFKRFVAVLRVASETTANEAG